MTDRDKVISHLAIIRTWAEVDQKRGGINPECCADIVKWIDEALELLKEQEPKAVGIIKNAYNHEFYYCPRCNSGFEDSFWKPMFCDKCGQAVKWDAVD